MSRVVTGDAAYVVWILGLCADMKPPVTSDTKKWSCKILLIPVGAKGKKAYLMNGTRCIRNPKVHRSKRYIYIYIYIYI